MASRVTTMSRTHVGEVVAEASGSRRTARRVESPWSQGFHQRSVPRSRARSSPCAVPEAQKKPAVCCRIRVLSLESSPRFVSPMSCVTSIRQRWPYARRPVQPARCSTRFVVRVVVGTMTDSYASSSVILGDSTLWSKVISGRDVRWWKRICTPRGLKRTTQSRCRIFAWLDTVELGVTLRSPSRAVSRERVNERLL